MNADRVNYMVLTVLLAITNCMSFAPQWHKSRCLIPSATTNTNESTKRSDYSNEWNVPETGLSGILFEERSKAHLTTSSNATLPLAMMVLDPGEFPSRSMAMRAIRYVSCEDTGKECILLNMNKLT